MLKDQHRGLVGSLLVCCGWLATQGASFGSPRQEVPSPRLTNQHEGALTQQGASPGMKRHGMAGEPQETQDPYLWLEGVEDAAALAWVETQNQKTTSRLKSHPQFTAFYNETLEVLNSKARIPLPSVRGEFVYDFWQDAEHERGLWRRTTIARYKEKNIIWESLLDVDALGRQEQESWVFKGAHCLRPQYEKCMISLSRGGKDATIVREFDVSRKAFVDQGFTLAESKGGVQWLDADTLLVARDFGEGSLTKSGYPRLVKLWKRGEDLAQAPTVFAGHEDDVMVTMAGLVDEGEEFHFFERMVSFFTSELSLYRHGKVMRLEVPEDAEFQGLFKGQLLLKLRSAWQVGGQSFQQGSLVGLALEKLLAGEKKVQTLVGVDEHSAIAAVDRTAERLIVNMFRNVQNELLTLQWNAREERWVREALAAPRQGTISVLGVDDSSPDFWYAYESFLQPASLYFVDGKRMQSQLSKSSPSFFAEDKFQVEQHWASSPDGTQVPYYVIARKGLALNAANPTLLYGYGGFEVSLDPYYLGATGRTWLERGGVYVIANIRGGGEFGPQWHQAALKEKRLRAYEDFASVAQALIARQLTSPAHLGIMGGSNGGLLMGASFVLHPELYAAVVCQVPLLDMKRYHKLLAGNSWMAEYGNPDVPEEWAYIKQYSPYQNVKKGVAYPHVFFTTSTKDDRVHPGHARKMAAKMIDFGAAVSYYENQEGGHAGAADHRQVAYRRALEFAFLWEQLR